MSKPPVIKPSMIKAGDIYASLDSLTSKQREKKMKDYSDKLEEKVNLWCKNHPEDFMAICSFKENRRSPIYRITD